MAISKNQPRKKAASNLGFEALGSQLFRCHCRPAGRSPVVALPFQLQTLNSVEAQTCNPAGEGLKLRGIAKDIFAAYGGEASSALLYGSTIRCRI